MLSYVIRRFMYMFITLLLVSVVAFIIIQLPPGNYLTSVIENLKASGMQIDEVNVRLLERQYGLDLPIYAQYFKWMWNLLHGNFGMSFTWNAPVIQVLAERLALTMVISFTTMLFVYAVAIPIGIYSATHQYSAADYSLTVIGFAGMATPNFLFALVLMYVFYKYFGLSAGGLFSPEYQLAPWSIAKVIDMLKHFPIPIIVIGTAGTAGLIRVMRSCLLDELRKQYVITARTKGVPELRLLFKYPIRIAINPMVSTVGGILPGLVSGGTIVAIVLSLPTNGPILLTALMAQDMYLAGSSLMLLTGLAIIGTLISDLCLVWVDPRIRYEKKGAH